MNQVPYIPPRGLQSGLAMTVYTAFRMSRVWQKHVAEPEPIYRDQQFFGAAGVPIFGKVAIPPNPRGTFIATYGISGSLEDQWFLQVFGRKAFAQGYAVVLFDWRAHGKTAELSPTLTSDGLYEGEDFVRIAAAAKAMGCPAPFWFTGYSLGGQLALWGVKSAQAIARWGQDLELTEAEIGGGAVICPSLDSIRSLQHLQQDAWGRQLDQSITRQLKKLARRIHHHHPGSLDPAAIDRVHNIWTFDQELVIERLGFATVEEYYTASSPLHQLPHLRKPTLILYAADDPMFAPSIIPDLQTVCANHPAIDLVLTQYGGHVGYISSKVGQRQAKDPDVWWAWNRILAWVGDRSHPHPTHHFSQSTPV